MQAPGWPSGTGRACCCWCYCCQASLQHHSCWCVWQPFTPQCLCDCVQLLVALLRVHRLQHEQLLAVLWLLAAMTIGQPGATQDIALLERLVAFLEEDLWRGGLIFVAFTAFVHVLLFPRQGPMAHYRLADHMCIMWKA